jgi:GT2 family glycosyltransferase
MEKEAKVSIIIPCSRPHSAARIKEELKEQTYKNYEVHVVSGYKKPSQARNKGATLSKGDVLVFLDDDAQIVQKEMLKNLIQSLEDIRVGLAGPSYLIPKDANWFQKRLSNEFARYEAPVVKKATESDLAGAVCAAVRRDLFNQVGGWNEHLVTAEDNELRERIRFLGYQVVLAPDCWLYHKRPDNLWEFLSKQWWYYYHSPLLYSVNPKVMGVLARQVRSRLHLFLYFLTSLFWFLPDIFFDKDIKLKFGFTPFKAMGLFWGRIAFVFGWLHYYSKDKKNGVL